MTIEQAYQVLQRTIAEELRHRHYARTVKVAKYARQMHLGDTQEDLIVQYKINETDLQKKQRVRLYNSLTPFVLTQIKKQISKIRRTDHIAKTIEHTSESSLKEIQQSISKFYAGQSLEDWLFDRIEYYYLNDPNAFIITERRDIRDERDAIKSITSYPFEVTSEQAINYKYENGNLQWLIVEHTRPAPKKKEDKITYSETVKKKGKEEKERRKTLSTFYFYHTGFTIQLSEFQDRKDLPDSIPYETLEIKCKGDQIRSFIVGLFETGTTEIPAIQVGTILDVKTYNHSFITPIHLVKDIFDDLIQLKSQEDVTRAIHVFAKLFQYAPECEFFDDSGRCDGGYISGDESKICPDCKGTGVNVHTTEQEAVLLALPSDYEKFFPLNQIAHYLAPPDHVPGYLGEKINEAIGRISIGLFGSDIFARPNSVNTATEVMVEKDEVHDVLSPIGITYSRTFEKIVRVTAQYLGKGQGLKVAHAFPLDFKTRTLGQLQAAYKNATETNASWEVLWGIECDILTKIYANNPTVVASAKIWQQFKPFAGKSKEEIVFIISSRANDDFDRVLYENFARIRREIEQESEGQFFALQYDEQKRRITEKVEELKGLITYSSQPSFADSFITETTEEDEAEAEPV